MRQRQISAAGGDRPTTGPTAATRHPTEPKSKLSPVSPTVHAVPVGQAEGDTLLPRASGTCLALHQDPRRGHGPLSPHQSPGGVQGWLSPSLMLLIRRSIPGRWGPGSYNLRAPSCQDLAEPCLSIFPPILRSD